MAGRHKIATDFKRKNGKHITHYKVGKFINKLKKTGSIADQLRSGHSWTSSDEGTTDMVLVNIVPYV